MCDRSKLDRVFSISWKFLAVRVFLEEEEAFPPQTSALQMLNPVSSAGDMFFVLQLLLERGATTPSCRKHSEKKNVVPRVCGALLVSKPGLPAAL